MEHADEASDSIHDDRWKQSFRRKLLAWFAHQARDLPWRRTRDPYAIWVSEVMLQQTQVATVIPYFERFLAEFPTISALAAADEQRVLRLWEGLGYYRRARQLHKAAKEMVERHDGRFPRDPAAVRRLPGIGRYTAGAVLSIAFDAREPILEANSRRLLARLLPLWTDPTTKAAEQRLWDWAAELVPKKQAGSFNQALMELGSQVCRPSDPACSDCPVQELCPTFQHGWQDQLPVRKPTQRLERVRHACVVVRRGIHVLLRRCGETERWAGMWDFPRFEIAAKQEAALKRELIEKVKQATAITIRPERKLTTIQHGVTRFQITLLCYEASWVADGPTQEELRWVELAELHQYPLNVTGRRIVKQLQA